MSKRNPGTLGVWGPKGTRVVAAESYWRQPLKWNAEAEAAGERRRVFCASLADVFEGPETMPAESWVSIIEARARLMVLIASTPALDWLLLTKRPQNVGLMVPPLWHANGLPPNVWIGTSVEDQAAADERIPHLLKVPASVRFLSCEPLLGPVDLRRWLTRWDVLETTSPTGRTLFRCRSCGRESVTPDKRCHPTSPGGGCASWDGIGLHWVIVGGESGANARPMDPAWARSIRDQCAHAGVPLFVKQMGTAYAGSGKGGDCIPDDLQIRELPAH